MQTLTIYSNFMKIAIALVVMFVVSTTNAHPGYYGTAFHAHTIEQAKEIAAQERKLVFIYAGDDNRGWRHFRWPRKETSELLDLLVRETVIVELNHIENHHQLAEYSLTEPGILILDEKGNLIEKLNADAVAEQVELKIQTLVGSKAGIARIEEAIASNTNPFFNRERLAAALALAGRYRESVQAYDRCLSEAIDEVSLAAKSRRTQVIDAIKKLMEKEPAALQMLERNRAKAEQQLKSHPQNAKLAGDIARIDKMLGKTKATLALFDEMPAGSRARNGLFDYVSDDLRRQQRYKEILLLVDPTAAIQGEITLYQRNKILKPISAERGAARGSRAFVVNRGVTLIEALAGVSRDNDCKRAIGQLTGFDATDSTRAKIVSALQRAGRSDLIQ